MKDKCYHLVWSTYNSRFSKRNLEYKNKASQEGVWLLDKDEVEIAQYILKISQELKLNVYALNLCGNHVHMFISFTNYSLSEVMKTLKGKSSFLYKKKHEIKNSFHLWGRKYYAKEIRDKKEALTLINYINENRKKHKLPENKKLKQLITQYIHLF